MQMLKLLQYLVQKDTQVLPACNPGINFTMKRIIFQKLYAGNKMMSFREVI
jgi:hypothetical protein